MPRRNRRSRARSRHIPMTEAPQPQPSTDAMAASLVERGLASRAVLTKYGTRNSDTGKGAAT